ncbi:hypothetical protein HF086_006979 [Spodoptera exigua]|uniref:Thioredoxin domain-containing protein n=1 Tax=Spodoptera exigua TaxID=7107 RepID=A0A922MJ41_SPOEX|nr:hypothetical protein HF086_006979 [Spodoptera exigua]
MDRKIVWSVLLLLFIIFIQTSEQAKKQRTAVITDIGDIKDFKKLLRTKTNVLILYVNELKSSLTITDVFKDTADAMKGQATLALIDCTSRNESSYSLSNFLRDPTGDLPWDEDPTATDIFHLQDGEALNKFLKKGAGAYKKSMIMFYAPWCGYCKTLKPEYVNAAAELKGESLLAAIDVSKPGNSKIRQLYNITGFPTLLYYEKGQYKLPYNGENKKQAIVDFMRDPTSAMQQKKKEVVDESWPEDSDDPQEPPPPPPPEKPWSEEESPVRHLDSATFRNTLRKIKHAIVMFYAPWCSHCTHAKPQVSLLAEKLHTENVNVKVYAVDASKNQKVADVAGIQTLPTFKLYTNGQLIADYDGGRTLDEMFEFCRSYANKVKDEL